MKNATAIVDTATWLHGSLAIASALYYKEKTGKGQFVDVSMLWVALQMLENNIVDTSVSGEEWRRSGNQDNVACPFGIYSVKDGYISIAICNEKQWSIFWNHFFWWENLFDSNQKRLENESKLVKMIQEKLCKFSRDEIVSLFKTLGVPWGKVLSTKEIIADEEMYRHAYLHKIHHPKLGECVVPYQAISFSWSDPVDYQFAPF